MIGSWGLLAFLFSLLTHKNGTRSSNFYRMHPIVSKVCTTICSIRILYARSITYNPCPWALEGCVHLKAIVICSLDCWKTACQRGGGGASYPRAILTLKRELVLYISNQMNFLKSSNSHTFHKKIKCPQDITYNPGPQTLDGSVTQKALLCDLWTALEQIAISNFSNIARPKIQISKYNSLIAIIYNYQLLIISYYRRNWGNVCWYAIKKHYVHPAKQKEGSAIFSERLTILFWNFEDMLRRMLKSRWRATSPIPGTFCMHPSRNIWLKFEISVLFKIV